MHHRHNLANNNVVTGVAKPTVGIRNCDLQRN